MIRPRITPGFKKVIMVLLSEDEAEYAYYIARPVSLDLTPAIKNFYKDRNYLSNTAIGVTSGVFPAGGANT